MLKMAGLKISYDFYNEKYSFEAYDLPDWKEGKFS